MATHGACEKYGLEQEAKAAVPDGIPHRQCRYREARCDAVVQERLFGDRCFPIGHHQLDLVSELCKCLAHFHNLHAVGLLGRHTDVGDVYNFHSGILRFTGSPTAIVPYFVAEMTVTLTAPLLAANEVTFPYRVLLRGRSITIH